MSKYYTPPTAPVVNDPAVPDDGTESAANQTLWSLIKSKLFDPFVTPTARINLMDVAIEAAFTSLETGVKNIRTFTDPGDFGGGLGTYSFGVDTSFAIVILIGKGGIHVNASTPFGSAFSTPGAGAGSGQMKMQVISDSDMAGADFVYSATIGGVDTHHYTDDLNNSLTVEEGPESFGNTLSDFDPAEAAAIGTEHISVPGGVLNPYIVDTPGEGAPSPLGGVITHLTGSSSIPTYGHGEGGADASALRQTNAPAGDSALIVIEFG